MNRPPAHNSRLRPPGSWPEVNIVEGQHVEKGDVLVELNSGTATAEYAEQEVERQKTLYAQHNTSLKNLQDAETQLALLRVTAPLSGTVTRLNVRPGAAVDVNTVVVEVMDLSRLTVSANIPAAEAGELKPGEEVQVLAEPPVTGDAVVYQPGGGREQRHGFDTRDIAGGQRTAPGPVCSLAHRHGGSRRLPCRAGKQRGDGRKRHSVMALVSGDEATQMPVQAGLREAGWVEIAGAGIQGR